MKTLVFHQSVGTAGEIIVRGGLVGVPTETVYGLAADGLNAAAVEKIYEVKNRPETKPISLLVAGMTQVQKFCADIPVLAHTLAAAFWPGPLTMVLKKRENVPEIVTAGGETVGVRCPDHPLTLALIAETGCPLAAPSANLSGMASPKSRSSPQRRTLPLFSSYRMKTSGLKVVTSLCPLVPQYTQRAFLPDRASGGTIIPSKLRR